MGIFSKKEDQEKHSIDKKIEAKKADLRKYLKLGEDLQKLPEFQDPNTKKDLDEGIKTAKKALSKAEENKKQKVIRHEHC